MYELLRLMICHIPIICIFGAGVCDSLCFYIRWSYHIFIYNQMWVAQVNIIISQIFLLNLRMLEQIQRLESILMVASQVVLHISRLSNSFIFFQVFPYYVLESYLVLIFFTQLIIFRCLANYIIDTANLHLLIFFRTTRF